MAGFIFAAHPAAFAIDVNLTRFDTVSPHLLHYKDAPVLVLAPHFRTCSYRPMPWDIWLIFFVLGVVVPWRGRHRLRKLLAQPPGEPAERISLYSSTIAFQWIAVALTAWRAWAHGFTFAQLGLVANNPWRLGGVAIIGAALLATWQWFNLRRIGRSQHPARARMQALAERILPRSPIERGLFFSLAVTAGICEEFLYRGFAIATLNRANLPLWSVVVLSSLLFGLAHLYQGRGGLVGTTVLGLLFGAVRVVFASVAPVVLWHVSVDVIAGIAGPLYLIDK
jgi:membrane protease YdiL (CAAX protease family)